jgi:hypothetical protein
MHKSKSLIGVGQRSKLMLLQVVFVSHTLKYGSLPCDAVSYIGFLVSDPKSKTRDSRRRQEIDWPPNRQSWEKTARPACTRENNERAKPTYRIRYYPHEESGSRSGGCH